MFTSKFQLFNKNASTIIYLSKIFMRMSIGTRIPTFDELSKEIGVARGTVQNSIKVLQEEGAIIIFARGHKGTFLVDKNTTKLLQLADIRSILGAMSLPYSKTYEGLATGIITTLQNKHDVPVNMAYMRDAVDRMDALLKGRYDFVVLSKGAAHNAIKNEKNIEIVIDFGPKTYLSARVIVFSKKNKTTIEDGMKVGIATNSTSQTYFSKTQCAGKNVTFVEYDYSHILPALKRNEIDATVWNKDEINDGLIQMNTVPIFSDDVDTSAVLVVDKDRVELINLFQEMIDVEQVKQIQEAVIQDKILPKY